MGVDYFVYTEAQIGDKWISIDPFVPKLVDNRKSWQEPHQYDGSVKYKCQPTYWNGSRSYFGDAYNKLRELGYSTKFVSLSDTVKSEWSKSVERELKCEESPFDYPTTICIDYETFKEYVNYNRYDYHRLVHKDQWVMFETGEIEDLYEVEHDDYASLTPEERQCYEYHEWDDSTGWNKYFKILNRLVEQRINDFEDQNGLIWDSYKIKYRIVVIASC